MTSSPIPYPQAARSLLRESIVTAVDHLVRTKGWAATTMSAVATAAGVSRQTVYNEFRSRPALAEAYVVREIEALVAEAVRAVEAHPDDPRAALQSAFELFLELASDEPLVQIIISGGGADELMSLLGTVARAVAVDRLTDLIVAMWAQVRVADSRLVADTVVRLAVSHAVLPGGRPAEAAANLTRLLGPFLDEIVG